MLDKKDSLSLGPTLHQQVSIQQPETRNAPNKIHYWQNGGLEKEFQMKLSNSYSSFLDSNRTMSQMPSRDGYILTDPTMHICV